ncbi:MAG: hypothetical protein H7175_22025 [Burkholderiales bacterium]|nr:hypothetical protein [Anaerolineae bacterium]
MSNLRKYWKRWFWAGAAFILLWTIVSPFLRPSPAQELAAARDRWNAQGIDSYNMMVSFGSYAYGETFSFTVQNGQIVEADRAYGIMFAPNVTPIPDPEQYSMTHGLSQQPVRLVDLTADGLFAFAETVLADEAWPSPLNFCDIGLHHEAEYDSEYGFIRSLRYTDCPPMFICGVMSHCSSGVTVREFEPLTD